jgi:hypothetical protein
LLVCRLLTRRNSLSWTVKDRHLGSAVMLAVTVILFVIAAANKRPGIAGLVDTFCLPALLLIIFHTTMASRKISLDVVLHMILGLNAVLTIYEFSAGVDLIPYRFEGVMLYDRRPAGLQGIAVNNAVIIGTYLIILLTGKTVGLPAFRRALMASLQVVALVACEERAAVIIGCVVLFALGIGKVLRGLTGGRVERFEAAGFAAMVPMLMSIVFWAWQVGIFDSFISRFQSDGGSAMTRVQAFEMLTRIPFGEVVFAPDVGMVDSVRRDFGLSLGIENPIIRLVLYQGLLATITLSFAFVYFLVKLALWLRPGFGWAYFYFLATIMSFESISTKTTLLAKFVLLMLVFFRPSDSDVTWKSIASPRFM